MKWYEFLELEYCVGSITYLDSQITFTGFVRGTVDCIQHLSTQNMQQKWDSPVIRINIVKVLIAPLINV
jgi:hypothetical protein